MTTHRSLFVASTFLLATLAPAVALADEPAADAACAPPMTAAPVSTTSVTSASSTAEPEADQTLFRSGTHHGGYGAPETKLTTVTGEAAVLVGVQAGSIIDKHFVIGGAGYGLASTHTPVAELQGTTGPSRIELGYGGPRLGYVFAPKQVVHFTLGALVGAGGVSISTKDPAKESGFDHHDTVAFFALEPQAEMEVNLSRYVRMAVGGSYRYIGDTGKPGLHASDLSGPAASLAVKIGYF